MSLNTNTNQSPYFDDFDESKNFHRILFKPSVAVQARELTQLQTILQNQIERFGDNILRQGTVISGCSFSEIRNLGFVKILDLQGNGAPVSMSSYKTHKAVGKTTGVTAIVTEVATGLESQVPDLNTLFVTYTGTGANDDKVFSGTETIEIRDIDTDALIAEVVAAGTVDTDSVGTAYAVRLSDGIIYQKGFFVRVDEQLTIVSKYTNLPDNISLGFVTDESIVNSNNDTSLLDNAQGHPNENAPGADRIVLTPRLIAVDSTIADDDETFLELQKYQGGRIVSQNLTTQYSTIFNEVQKRTFEESGNYTVNEFPLAITNNSANSSLLDLSVGRGLGYVDGRRVELLDRYVLPLDKATEFETEIQQNITTNYGSYVIVKEYMGGFSYQNAATVTLHDVALARATAGSTGTYPSASKIGTAKIRSVMKHAGTLGSAQTQYRLYITDIVMDSGKNFDDVRSVFHDGSIKGAADLILESGRPVIKERAFGSYIFEIGRSAIKSVVSATTDYVYRTVNSSLTADSITANIVINLTGNDEWPYGIGILNDTQKADFEVIANATQSPYTQGVPINLTGATIEVTSSQSLTITLPSTPAADMAAIVYYNVKRTIAAPRKKDIKYVYVKIDTATHPNTNSGSYSLGLPDVIGIENVWQGNTYSESNPSVKSKFRVLKNDTLETYNLSRLVTAGYSIPANSKLLVKLKVYRKNTTGSYAEGFFTVDSYPINDSDGAPNTSIRTEDIPIFVAKDGKRYDLRNCIDFRPYAENTASYAETEAAATINPNGTTTFGSGDLYIPAPNENIETDYEYYMNRFDILYIDSEGNFVVDKGEASEKPTPPAPPSSGMILATINVPAYPSLPKNLADRKNRPEFGVTIKTNENRRYTMRDIGGIERRLDSLEYYTALNALEQKAVNMLITDATGADRFKNGIFVDNFNNLKIADIKDTEFKAGIDPAKSEITPKFRAIPLDLTAVDENSWVSARNYDDTIATITPNTDRFLVKQLTATGTRNCVTDYYIFSGKAYMQPSYDAAYDTSRAPDVTIDVGNVFSDFVDSLNSIVPLQVESTRIGAQNVTVTNTDIRFQNAGTNTVEVGDFVTNVSYSPFMRGRNVRIFVSGLRPNTLHWFFFDGTAVNPNIAPARRRNGATRPMDMVRAGKFGTGVRTDAKGVLRAIFRIPPKTFFTGDRKLEIYDTQLYQDRDTSTSRASFIYRAFNMSVEKAGLSTRLPEVETTARVLVQNFPIQQSSDEGSDPIAQTFFVPRGETNDNALAVDKVWLFFRKKSPTFGVTVEIRETVNGYPAKRKIPFATKHLTSDEVTVSGDGSVWTPFIFDKPIYLKSGQEYALVIKPDANSPDYRVFTSTPGENGVISGRPIVRDMSSGTLFASTNNRAWTAFQNENLKFAIFRNEYTTKKSTIYLGTRDCEFLTVDSATGDFAEGEYVAKVTANSAGTISVTSGNTTITGTGTNFSQHQLGDTLVIYTGANTYELAEISAITSNTVLTVKEAIETSNSAASYFESIVGRASYWSPNEPAKLVLQDSTARSGKVFVAGSSLLGLDSGTTANTVSVDNQQVSYLQASIAKATTTKTSLDIVADTLSIDGGGTYTSPMAFGSNKYLTTRNTVIKSRSNEVSDNTGRSFRLRMNLYNNEDSTPFVDHEASNMIVYAYDINNDTTSETTSSGNAASKYISKTVELAEGMDADDLKVFLTAYRPPGTDVEVYVRFKNEFDTRDFKEIEWTQLTKKAETDGFSSNANRDDFREIEYFVPTKTTFTNGGGAGLESTTGILRYQGKDGAVFDRYKVYAIKIVMLSSSYNRVPRLRDVRAIALS